MPGLVVDGLTGGDGSSDETHGQDIHKSSITARTSPKSPLTPLSHGSGPSDTSLHGVIDTSIEQLYHNVCDMQSSDQSPSRASFISYGAESRIDSELCHLVGVDARTVEKPREVLVEIRNEIDEVGTKKGNMKRVNNDGSKSVKKTSSMKAKRNSPFRLINQACARSSPGTN